MPLPTYNETKEVILMSDVEPTGDHPGTDQKLPSPLNHAIFTVLANQIMKDDDFRSGFCAWLNGIIQGQNGFIIEDIVDVYVELSEPADNMRMRLCRLDLLVMTQDGGFCICEVQVGQMEHIVPRMLLYFGRHFAGNAHIGQTDYAMPKYALISLIDFPHQLFEDEQQFHFYSTLIVDNAPAKKITEQLQIHLVSLHQYRALKLQPQQGDVLTAWMHYFAYGYQDEEEKARLIAMSKSVESLDKNYRGVVSDPVVLDRAWREQADIFFYNAELATALKKGEEKKAQEIARNMLRRGRPIEEIIEDTDLTREEIELLRGNE